MLENVPTYEIYYPMDSEEFVIKDSDKFHNRVIEFIDLRLSDNFASNDPDDDILCFFKIGYNDSNHLEARLEPEGYKKSLETCLTYFTENEEYEKCKIVTKLQEKIK